jgi:hypothetical protein
MSALANILDRIPWYNPLVRLAAASIKDGRAGACTCIVVDDCSSSIWCHIRGRHYYVQNGFVALLAEKYPHRCFVYCAVAATVLDMHEQH